MGLKHKQQNEELAEKLGTTPKIINYVRPRLLSAVYKEDEKKLIEKIRFHQENAKRVNPTVRKALERNKKLSERSNDPHLTLHKKRIAFQEANLGDITRSITFYDETVKFLENLTPEQRKVLLQK